MFYLSWHGLKGVIYNIISRFMLEDYRKRYEMIWYIFCVLYIINTGQLFKKDL